MCPFFDAPLDRPLPDGVREMRSFAADVRSDVRAEVEPGVIELGQLCRQELDVFSQLLLAPLETTDLDLCGDSRFAAYLPLGARALSLGHALVDLTQLGYGVEAYPVGRAIGEVTGMLRVFLDPEGEPLARAWLRGKTPRPVEIRKAENEMEASAVRDGIADVDTEEARRSSLRRALGRQSRGPRVHAAFDLDLASRDPGRAIA